MMFDFEAKNPEFTRNHPFVSSNSPVTNRGRAYGTHELRGESLIRDKINGSLEYSHISLPGKYGAINTVTSISSSNSQSSFS